MLLSRLGLKDQADLTRVPAVHPPTTSGAAKMPRPQVKKRTVIYDEEETSAIEDFDVEVKESKGAGQVNSLTTNTEADGGPDQPQEGSGKRALTRLVKKKHEDTPEVSDEIEDSEAEQSDEIAEILELEAHEVMERPKDREKRRGMASIMKDGAKGGKTPKKKSVAATAAQLNMTNSMLKYTKPNVSNVQEKDRGGSKENERNDADENGNEEPREGRRPCRAAAAAVNYNEEFIATQAFVFAAADNLRGAHRANEKSKATKKGVHGRAEDRVIVPDSEDECEEMMTELCTRGAKAGRAKGKESETMKSEATRRSARQRSRVSYVEVDQGVEFEGVEAPARVLRKKALEALSKQKEVENEVEAKKRTITDLNQFVFQKGAARTGGNENEDGEERATRRGNGRALRDRSERNLNRSRRGRSRRSSPDSDGDSSESEEERPRKKKPKHTSPVRKSERVRKPVKASLAEEESDEDQDEESGDEEVEEAASGEDEEEEAEASDDEDAIDGRVEKILAPAKGSIDVENRRFVVKFHERSYRAAKAVSEGVLMQHCPQLLRNYLLKGGEGTEDEPFNPEYAVIDRIIADRHRRGERQLLVKWRGLEYGRATWEREDDLTDDADAIERFESLSRKPGPHPNDGKESGELEFKTGRTLRDYQLVGVRWLAQNYQGKRSCMLGDEMGLGKTFQTVAMLETLHRRGKPGPFLVVAPVSTLGHWQREVESLTDLYCVVYKGDATDRDMIRKHEFGAAKGRKYRFHVLLTSFELLVKDAGSFKNITWRYVVVDEAHRLKGRNSLASKIIRNMDLKAGELLLLTGTPIQNNTSELFALLSLLDPEKYDSEDGFLEKFGNMKDTSRVRELQEQLKPILLRRKKEDVEKSIPQKEEVIIWVELTQSQRSYYKAVYEGQIGTLLKGVKKGNLPNMRNVAMELRKLCNHPFLSNSVAENMIECRRWEARGQLDHLSDEALRSQLLQQGSGKMVLLNKLLPKLREGGHKVLIFSQFKIMLDLLEDYIVEKGYPFERIDGDITGSGRQAAMDRFQAEGSDSFIFLLSTRAGGLGITLTAADTCIIYDSDWNPQNDLQAMARCHRIGQTKDVKVYRLVTKNTYEEQLFQSASRKYGLDEAILGDNMGDQRDPEQSKDIENLLLKGAYHCLQDEAAEQAAARFGEEDIEQILMQRTETRQVGGAGKSSFAEATFAPVEEEMKWETLLPEAVALEREREEAAARALVEGIKQPRRRNQVNYTEKAAYAGSESDEDFDGSEEGRRARKSSPKETGWTDIELKRLEEKLVSLGEGRWAEIQTEARLTSKPLADVTAVCSALVKLFKHAVAAPKPAPPAPVAAQTLETPVPIVGLPAPIGDPLADSGPPAVAAAAAPAAAAPFKTAFELDVPADARKAFDAAKFRERVAKNAQKYLQSLHERKALASAVGDNDSLTKWLITNHKFVPGRHKLPQWWDWQCDKDLMVGAHSRGHKAFKLITGDSTFRFRSLLAIRDPNPDALRTAPSLLPASLSSVAVPSLSAGATHGAPVVLPTVPSSPPRPPVPAFLPREMPSDQILSSRLKKLIAQNPASRTKAEIAEAAARQARIAAAREERARAEALLAPSPGQSSGEDSEGRMKTERLALQIKLEAERNRRKAERKAEKKRERMEEAAREFAQAKARRAADVAFGEKRQADQPAESPRKVSREGEQHKSPRQPLAGNGGKSAGQKSSPKEPTASADIPGKFKTPLAPACLVLGSPEKRKSSPGNGETGGKSPLPVRPALSPSAANAACASPAKPTGQSGASLDAKPAAGGAGRLPPGGMSNFQGSMKVATHRPKELAPGSAAKPRPAGVTQVLSKQGAPKRTSSEGGSVEVVRSADFEKAKKKRQRKEGALGGSGLGGGSQGGGKSGRVQPAPDKENQQPSKKKKKHKFDRTDIKQQTLMTFMRAKPTPAVV